MHGARPTSRLDWKALDDKYHSKAYPTAQHLPHLLSLHRRRQYRRRERKDVECEVNRVRDSKGPCVWSGSTIAPLAQQSAHITPIAALPLVGRSTDQIVGRSASPSETENSLFDSLEKSVCANFHTVPCTVPPSRLSHLFHLSHLSHLSHPALPALPTCSLRGRRQREKD